MARACGQALASTEVEITSSRTGADPENLKRGGPGKIVYNLLRKSANFTHLCRKFYTLAAKGGVLTPWTPP